MEVRDVGGKRLHEHLTQPAPTLPITKHHTHKLSNTLQHTTDDSTHRRRAAD